MWNDKIRWLREFVIKHSKIAFPIVLVAAVAVTVAFAMGIDRVEEQMDESMSSEEQTESSVEETLLGAVETEVELIQSEDGKLYTLMATYYNALANGDVDTIRTISNYVEDTESIRIQELSKYIESYPQIDIYTKTGPVEGSYIAYVYTHVTFYGHEERVPGLMTFYICTDENGDYYMNESEAAEDVLEYVRKVSLQDDVVELANATNTEYNDLLRNHLDLADYIGVLEKEVSQATGEALAEQIAAEEAAKAEQNAADVSGQSQESGTASIYATATATVNVRSSDSQQAEKLGKLAEGERIQILEQRPNGWSKVWFEGKEGYIKAEYLQSEGSADTSEGTADATVSGSRSAKATANLNLRKEASTSSEKLGVVIGGDSVEVLSESGGWSQIRYNGTVGYVKTEYLQ